MNDFNSIDQGVGLVGCVGFVQTLHPTPRRVCESFATSLPGAERQPKNPQCRVCRVCESFATVVLSFVFQCDIVWCRVCRVCRFCTNPTLAAGVGFVGSPFREPTNPTPRRRGSA